MVPPPSPKWCLGPCSRDPVRKRKKDSAFAFSYKLSTVSVWDFNFRGDVETRVLWLQVSTPGKGTAGLSALSYLGYKNGTTAGVPD